MQRVPTMSCWSRSTPSSPRSCARPDRRTSCTCSCQCGSPDPSNTAAGDHLVSDDAPRLASLSLRDFRCYEEADVAFPPGVTLIIGANAQGKTSLLEAVAWAATGSSFRGVPDAALVRAGEDVAIVRADVVDGERVQRFEAEIHAVGRNRVQANGQAVRRVQDRAAVMRVTVFAPDDLQLVKSGPAGRRAYLDDLLVATAPRYAAVRVEYDRILRQRNALLKQG